MKTHWKKLENPDYIGAYSLPEGQDLTVKITEVKRETVTGTGGKKEECTVAYLENQKPFILNRTNMKTISKIYGTPYIEDWKGKELTLFVSRIKAFGEDNVECLRIRPAAPQKPVLKQSDAKNWDKVLKAIQNGYAIEQIKTKWEISEENENLLKEQANG